MIARAVDRLDPEGRARRSARAIVLRGHVDDDRLARLRLIEPVDRNARDEAGRQVEQQVDPAFEPQPGQRLGELRPDALEVGQRGQEPIGRTAWRERGVTYVEIRGVAGALKKNQKYVNSE